MKCELCHTNEVSQAISIEKDGGLSELFVCAACAAKHKAKATDGIERKAGGQGAGKRRASSVTSVADVMMRLHSNAVLERAKSEFNRIVESLSQKEERTRGKEAGKRVCPACGTSQPEVLENLQFGCPECFRTFEDEVTGMTQMMQPGDTHVGKIPASMAISNEIIGLKRDLDTALGVQNFEKAATLQKEIETRTSALNELGKKSGRDSRE